MSIKRSMLIKADLLKRHFFKTSPSVWRLTGLAVVATTLIASCTFIIVVAAAVFTVSAYNCVANGKNSACTAAAGDLIAAAGGWQGLFGPALKADPPAADLQYFDAAQASAVLTPQNLTLQTTGGTAIVSITDESNGVVLGTEGFPFVISNQVATFTNPSAVTQWVRSFSGYTGNVSVNVKFYVGTSLPPSGQSGKLVATIRYNDSPWLSAAGSLAIPPSCNPQKPSPELCK